MNFQYDMPTRIFAGRLRSYAREFSGYGERALIVTGRSSALNGSLDDVLSVLKDGGIAVHVFNSVEENPSVENVMEAVEAGREFGAEFIVGIGGGSPLDAAKAAALLIPCPDKSGEDLWRAGSLAGCRRLPVLAVPTTAGTGSETTPFSVITAHDRQTKASLPHFLFPDKAFLDVNYTTYMPDTVTLHTAADTLSHLIEGYLTTRADMLNDRLVEGGLAVYGADGGALTASLSNRRFDIEIREKLMVNAALGGIVITHTKTTLPHHMGYLLTYYKKIPHGAACGVLLAEYMRFHENKEKTANILRLLGMPGIDAFNEWMRNLLDVHVTITPEEADAYTQALCANQNRLKNHPFPVTPEDVRGIYTRSVLL